MRSKNFSSRFRHFSVGIVIIASLIFSLWLALPFLLGRGMESWLNARGIDAAHIDVSAVNTKGIIFGPTWIGDPKVFRFERADIIFAKDGLLPSGIEGVGLLGLQTQIDMSNPSAPFIPGLEPLFADDAKDGDALDLTKLPLLSIKDAQILVADKTQQAQVTIDLVARYEDAALPYVLNINAIEIDTQQLRCRGQARIAVASPVSFTVESQLRTANNADCLTFSYANDPFHLKAQTILEGGNPLWSIVGNGPLSGQATLQFESRKDAAGAYDFTVWIKTDQQGLVLWDGSHLRDGVIALTGHYEKNSLKIALSEDSYVNFVPSSNDLTALPAAFKNDLASAGLTLTKGSYFALTVGTDRIEGHARIGLESAPRQVIINWIGDAGTENSLSVRATLPQLSWDGLNLKNTEIVWQSPLSLNPTRVEIPHASLHVTGQAKYFLNGWSIDDKIDLSAEIQPETGWALELVNPRIPDNIVAIDAILAPLTIRGPDKASYRLTPGMLTIKGDIKNTAFGGARIDAADWAIHQKDQGLVAEGIGFTAGIQYPDPDGLLSVEGSFKVNRFARREPVPLHLPVNIQGSYALANQRLQAQADIRDVSGKVHIQLQAAQNFDAKGKQGSLRFASSPFYFGEGDLSLYYLSPALSQWGDALEGKAAINGELGWGGSKSTLKVLLKDFSLTAAGTRIERINTVLEFKQLWPLSSRGRQDIAIGAIAAGVPLTDGLIGVRFEDGIAQIEEGRLRLGDGTVRLKPAAFDTLTGNGVTKLIVQDVNLAALLTALDIDGLTGTGLLGGTLPLVMKDGKFQVGPGKLTNQAPGTLKYAADEAASLGSTADQLALLFGALANFHYSDLSLNLMRHPDGESQLGLHIVGNNPEFYGGYPVELNINIAGALEQILSDSLAGYRVPAEIEKKLQNFLVPPTQ